MTISIALRVIPGAALILAAAATPIVVVPVEAATSKPVVRDHRTPKWNHGGAHHNRPVVRDHRSPTWQPRE